MKKWIVLVPLAIAGLVQAQLTQFINPFIGTGGHGHTFPGACVPFGMVQLSPDTRIDGSWDGCSGYHYSDNLIYAFSHTHLSGTGVSDYGDVAFMPRFVDKPVQKITEQMQFTAKFDHNKEQAKAGFYSVKLDNGLLVELTASKRVGVQRYTANRNGYLWVQLDLKHRDELISGEINLLDTLHISGYRQSKAWATDQWVYFYSQWSKKPDKIVSFKNDKGIYKAYFGFWVVANEGIEINTALSSVSENGAKLNLNAEKEGFEGTKNKAFAAWENKMAKIKTEGLNTEDKTKLYTALYHCYIHPSVLNDVDGSYRGRDNKIHKIDWNGDYYTVFSLWDTYRALHPLLNILEPKVSADFMHTFLAQYQHSGRLPMWELWSNESNCMIGMHSIPVIWNTYLNGNIDYNLLGKLYAAACDEIENQRPDFKKYMEKGYLEIQDESESVSKTIEISYDFYFMHLMAMTLRKFDEASLWESYARGYKNLYNPITSFYQPRLNGQWAPDFDPYQVNNNYTEANAWQYAVLPHELNVLSSTNSEKILGQIFEAKIKTTGREQPDITGFIGQYVHGNEPSHHYLYKLAMYNPEKAHELIKQVQNEFYSTKPDGLIGNEDCGQMSAWYVFSTLGFYPDVHSPSFVYGHMQASKIDLQTKWGVKHLIHSQNQNLDSYLYRKTRKTYLQDWQDLDTFYFKYESYKGDLVTDAIMEFDNSLTAPILNVKNQMVNVQNIDNDMIYKYLIYKEKVSNIPFDSGMVFNTNTGIKVPSSSYLYIWSLPTRIKNQGFIPYTIYYSPPIFKPFEVVYNCTLNNQYKAIGNQALIDSVYGDLDWRKGNWQGIQQQDLDLVVDLRKCIKIKQIGIHTLQDVRSWICFPKVVYFYGSKNNSEYKLLDSFVNNQSINDLQSSIKSMSITLKKAKKYRYLHIKALQYGPLPSWHPGAGEPSFIFVDEIELNQK